MIDFGGARRKRSKLDMAPLIDVVFLLLIFFMLTFAVQGKGLNLSLPEGESEGEKTEEELVVKIGEDNSLFVNSQSVPLEKFGETIEKKLELKRDKVVIIEAHEKSNYDRFAQVLDIARQSGAEDFAIVK